MQRTSSAPRLVRGLGGPLRARLGVERDADAEPERARARRRRAAGSARDLDVEGDRVRARRGELLEVVGGVVDHQVAVDHAPAGVDAGRDRPQDDRPDRHRRHEVPVAAVEVEHAAARLEQRRRSARRAGGSRRRRATARPRRRRGSSRSTPRRDRSRVSAALVALGHGDGFVPSRSPPAAPSASEPAQPGDEEAARPVDVRQRLEEGRARAVAKRRPLVAERGVDRRPRRRRRRRRRRPRTPRG